MTIEPSFEIELFGQIPSQKETPCADENVPVGQGKQSLIDVPLLSLNVPPRQFVHVLIDGDERYVPTSQASRRHVKFVSCRGTFSNPELQVQLSIEVLGVGPLEKVGHAIQPSTVVMTPGNSVELYQ